MVVLNKDLEGLLCARHCFRLQACVRRLNKVPSLVELTVVVVVVVVVVGEVRQIINKYTNKFILLRGNL